jgi:hypothetical protein
MTFRGPRFADSYFKFAIDGLYRVDENFIGFGRGHLNPIMEFR